MSNFCKQKQVAVIGYPNEYLTRQVNLSECLFGETTDSSFLPVSIPTLFREKKEPSSTSLALLKKCPEEDQQQVYCQRRRKGYS